MIRVEAIIREEKYEDVKKALNDIEVNGITVYQVMGCGVQKGWTEYVRGQEVQLNLLPKVKFEIVVSTQEWADKTVATIMKTACTGNMGDGKIFVYNLDQVIRISTGQTGIDAIN